MRRGSGDFRASYDLHNNRTSASLVLVGTERQSKMAGTSPEKPRLEAPMFAAGKHLHSSALLATPQARNVDGERKAFLNTIIRALFEDGVNEKCAEVDSKLLEEEEYGPNNDCTVVGLKSAHPNIEVVQYCSDDRLIV